MREEIYQIAEVPSGKLAIMPRPRAGDWLEDEVSSWRQADLTIIVSLLEDSEIVELGLEQEQAICEQAGIRFVRFPIPDRGLPASEAAISRLVELLVEELRRDQGVGIHCRMGIGRSSLLATCVLAVLGLPVESAWAAVQRARGLSVPDTPAQRAWVESWFNQ